MESNIKKNKQDLVTSLLNSLCNLKSKNLSNTIISPLSIFQIIALTANGAGGETRNEILNILSGQASQLNSLEWINKENAGIISLLKTSESTKIANAIFTKAEPKKDFLALADLYYQACVEKLESIEQVNNWCSEKTEGKITKILDRFSNDSRMILLNAFYFKSEWVYQFQKSCTSQKDFQGSNNKIHKVEVMSQSLTNVLYFSNKNVQVIILPYKDLSTSAVIILPKNSLESYCSNFSESKLNTYIMKSNYCNVRLQLPKFKVKFEASLRDALIKIGLNKAFSKNADFTFLSEESLHIADVFHSTHLMINESGTEAAAVTAVKMIPQSSMSMEIQKFIEMNVNRSFMFVLKNQQILQPLLFAKIFKP